MKRRLLASIMTLVMMLSMLPTAVWAADTGDESDPQETEDAAEPTPQSGEGETPTPVNATDGELDLKDGSIVITKTGYTQGNAESETAYTGEYTISGTTTENTITVQGDATITLKDANIDVSDAGLCACDIQSGTVTLKLANGSDNSLKSGWVNVNDAATGISYAGLWVREKAAVIIQGTDGKLTAVGGGRGTSNLGNTGLAAGIGASRAYASQNQYYALNRVGSITIEGGEITATGSAAGGYGGAGIGGGSNTSDITITGGNVTANSGLTSRGSAGIGSSFGQNAAKHIVIKGDAVVNATGGSAGIGGGAYYQAGTIEISGNCTVNATSIAEGAGIGGGGGAWAGDNAGISGKITISGGTVTAQGSAYGAGIGGGGCNSQAGGSAGAQASGDITISGGVVVAKGGTHAPGIGSGVVIDHNGNTVHANSGKMGTIIISGGSVTATNGSSFAATGKSYNVLDDDGLFSVVSGIGRGKNENAATSEAFETWAPTDGQGNAILAVKTFSDSSVTYTRNGGESVTVTGTANGTTLYLPEGYYAFDGAADDQRVLIAAADDKTDAASLIADIKNTSENAGGLADLVRALEGRYNALSASLQYYVDEQTKSTHTLAGLKEALKDKNVKTSAVLDPANGESTTTVEDITYWGPVELSKPVRANYVFDGWFQGNDRVSDAEGHVSNWPYLDTVTLTAHWSRQIKGDGTARNPYEICDGANLVALSRISMNIGTDDDYGAFGLSNSSTSRTNLLKASYKLMDNISVSTADGFYGIGGYIYTAPSAAKAVDWNNRFSGTFDGNHKTITLDIDTTKMVRLDGEGDDDYTYMGHVVLDSAGNHVEVISGLFNVVNGATIQDLTIDGSVTLATKKSYAGVLVGQVNNTNNSTTRIENCTNKAAMVAGAIFNVTPIAAFVGNAAGGTLEVIGCDNDGNMTAGAALPLRDGTTTKSQGNSIAGGIVCTVSTKATIEGCTNYGTIRALRSTDLGQRNSRAAGIAAYIYNADVTITDCKNYGDVICDSYSLNAAGGIVGTTISTKPITNCINYGSVYAKDGQVGAIFGGFTTAGSLPDGATLVDCYQVVKAAADNAGWKLSDDGTIAVKGEELKIPVTGENDNYYSAERYVVNGEGTKSADLFSASGDTLYNNLTHNENLTDDVYPFQSAADAYVISNAQQYVNLVLAIRGDEQAQKAVLGSRLSSVSSADTKAVALASAYVKIAGDFTLTDVDTLGLGTAAIPFIGTIDGQDHTVTYAIDVADLSKDQPSFIGFVGSTTGATVKNLAFAGSINLTTTAENDAPLYVGPAAAYGSGVVLDNCHSTVTVTVVSGCTVDQATMGNVLAGGLLGYTTSSTVTNSSHKGNVTVVAPKYGHAGGITGYYSGTMENVTAMGSVSATEEYRHVAQYGEDAYAGGIAGEMASGTLTNVVAVGTVFASNDCSLSNTFAYAGGFAGKSGTGKGLTIVDSKALTTISTTVSNSAKSSAGAMVGSGKLTLSGTNWYVKTDTVSVSDAAAKPIDTTVLDGRTFGDTITMAVPDGVTMSSNYASLDSSLETDNVSFVEAGKGAVELVYDGQTFFTTEITVAPKTLTADDVIITGVNSAYPSDDDAAVAKANISVIYGDKKLVEGTDYTVAQDKDSHKFTISFTGSYTGSAEKSYTVEAGTLVVTTTDYTGTYDGEAHSITVIAPEGATVEYKTEKTSYSTTNVEEKNAGTYVVYWRATKDEQTVTGSAVIVINKAKLTIKADNQSMYVGGKLPTPTYTATGLVKGEKLTTEPTLECAADGMTVGKFDIVPSGADAGNNYEITYVNGTLTVSRRHSSPSSTTPDPEPTPDNSTSFSDVPANAYFADAVEWAVNKGVTNGLSDTMFGPYESCTRAQIVTFLWRAAGSPEPKAASSFTDVPASAYYAKAVAWAVENGITNGMTETTFAPDATCTRGQSVTFLYRALKGTASGSANFTDVAPDAFYADAVNWAVANNVTNGTSATTFSPNADCTRAEIVTFLYRAYQGK